MKFMVIIFFIMYNEFKQKDRDFMAKVLFVDDEPDVEFLAKQKFRKQIESGNFNLVFASNGREALQVLEKEAPVEVIVSDLNMPEMDGLTLLDKLKEASPETKTIVVSAYGDTKTLRSAMNKGAYDFVTKPVDFKELEDTILRTLSTYKLPATHLYEYQQYLAKEFPDCVDLSYPHGTKNILWDSFEYKDEATLLLGVTVSPSPIPMDIGIGLTHSFIKAELLKNKDISLDNLLKRLSSQHKELIPLLVIGHYHRDSKTFASHMNGDFQINLISETGKSRIIKTDTVILSLGDVVTLNNPLSPSHLSLRETA